MISTVVTGIGGGAIAFQYFYLHKRVDSVTGIVALGGLTFGCGLPSLAIVRGVFTALWSSHPTPPPGLATPPPLFFLASSFCEPLAPYTAAHDPTP